MPDCTRIVFFVLCLFCTAELNGQPVFFRNGSLEDTPSAGRPPKAWFFCGKPGESPPDILPNGLYGVTQQPAHGATFAGLVVRDNGTCEAIGQQLEQPLQAGKCYRLRIFACRSENYLSLSRKTHQPSNYHLPVRVRIWGGNQLCYNKELLAVSELIVSPDWQPLDFVISPTKTFQHLIIEAAPENEQGAFYNGNVLLDFIQPMIPADPVTHQPLIKLPQVEKVDNQISAAEWIKLIAKASRSFKPAQAFADTGGNTYWANLDWWFFFRSALVSRIKIQIRLSKGNASIAPILLEAAESAGFPSASLKFKILRKDLAEPYFSWKNPQLLILGM